jgi:hypothetical protein
MKRLGMALVAVVLLAGCGSSPPAAVNGASARQQFVTHALAQAVRYAQCMRTHGVSGFSDPHVTSSAQGVGIGQGVSAQTASSPAFNSAQQACRKLQPTGAAGPGSHPVSAAQHAEMVRFAVCVRHHGVPDMPDPAANGVFQLPDTINQQSPAFNGAIKGCLPNGMPLSLNQGP